MPSLSVKRAFEYLGSTGSNSSIPLGPGGAAPGGALNGALPNSMINGSRSRAEANSKVAKDKKVKIVPGDGTEKQQLPKTSRKASKQKSTASVVRKLF